MGRTGLLQRALGSWFSAAVWLLILSGEAIGLTTIRAGVHPMDLARIVASPSSGAAVNTVKQHSFLVNDINGESGGQIPVVIILPTADELASAEAGPGTFFLIRNIPMGVSFSAGMPSGRIWVLPLSEVVGLHLVSEREIMGEYSMEFLLVGSQNRLLANQTVPLSLRRPGILRSLGTAATIEKPAGSPAPEKGLVNEVPPHVSLSPTEEAMLLQKGEELLGQGDITAARILFEELAQKGSARGALACARSYDPVHARDSQTSALRPDLNMALEWYRRADKLGSAEARNRIAQIRSKR